MGPRLISSGKATASATTILVAMTSMGPRLISRGKGWPPTDRAASPTASMGPRLISRGKWGFSSLTSQVSSLLQWGRG